MRQTFARNPCSIETIEGFVGELSGGENVTLDDAVAKHVRP